MWLKQSWERMWAITCVTVIAVVFIVVNPMMPVRAIRARMAASAPAGGPPVPGDFPTIGSVGPAVEPTITYGGSCTITTDNLVIEDRIMNCTSTGVVMDTDVTGVIIRNSVVNGGITTEFDQDSAEANDNNHPLVFTVESSRIIATGLVNRPVNVAHYQVYDSLLLGDASGAWAHNKVIIEDSYITTAGNSEHQSGMRMLKNSTLRDNTVFCEPFPEADEDNNQVPDPDGGCSADAVFYREWGIPVNLTVEHNYFKRNPTGQGHYSATRWIDCNVTNDCINNSVTRNLFDLNQGTDGGEFPNDTGDVWDDNWWTDGVPALTNEAR